MKYQVELEGFTRVRYSMEVDAEDEMAAKQAAVERAPSSRPGMWDKSGGEVLKVDAVDIAPVEDYFPR